ncbi:hypothetical protein TNCV_3797971 [Trichonephila clavipes]|nr:hypothetical protein TNCV_3797971 [Trichonephila clavipes]
MHSHVIPSPSLYPLNTVQVCRSGSESPLEVLMSLEIFVDHPNSVQSSVIVLKYEFGTNCLSEKKKPFNPISQTKQVVSLKDVRHHAGPDHSTNISIVVYFHDVGGILRTTPEWLSPYVHTSRINVQIESRLMVRMRP